MHRFLIWLRETKIRRKSKLYYTDTESFIVYIKTEDIYVDITKDFQTRFDTSNFELGRPIPKAKKKIVIELMMKDELGGKIMK